MDLRHGWCTPLIAALGKQRQGNLYKFHTCLVYRASSQATGATQRNPVLKEKSLINPNSVSNKTKQKLI